MRSLFLCSVLLSCFTFTFALPVGRLVILGSTPDLSFDKAKSSIAPENVAGVISHILGVGGVHPLPKYSLPTGNFFKTPKVNLLVVAEGAPVKYSAGQLGEIELASLDIENLDSFAEIEESARDLVSRMMSGKPFGASVEPATVGDLLCQVNDKSLVVSIAADLEMLQAVSLHDDLTKQHPEWNVITASVQRNFGISFAGKSSNLREAINKLYSTQGLSAYNVNSIGGIPLFDLNVDEDKLFLMEMKVLSTLLQILKSSDVGPLLDDNSPDFITFVSSSLQGINEKYGESSEQSTVALYTFISVMKDLQSQFNTMFSQQGVFELLLVQGATQPQSQIRERRSVVKRDYHNIAAPCYENIEVCQNSTNSCSNATASECVLVKKIGDTDCYRCRCAARYAGDACEFISLVAPTHTIFWTSLAVFIALVLVCSSLAYMDPGKDTLLFKTASKSKAD